MNKDSNSNGKTLLFDFVEQARQVARIRVVGVGGAGGNAVNRMIEDQLSGVDFIAMNTDLQALELNKAPCRIQIGKNLTRGLGAGGVPEVGRKAIEENKDAVIEVLSDTDMVFIAGGMGGGTGTGAAPVVAEIARDLGALTVGIVTKPFLFEGGKRMKRAEAGIRDLKEHVDTLIVVPNQRLLSIVPKNTPLEEAFRKADEILLHATKGISDVINIPGLVNLDFADVQTVMSQMGDAIMGSGMATGETRGKEAAEIAIHSSSSTRFPSRVPRVCWSTSAVARVSPLTTSTRPPRSFTTPLATMPTSSSAPSSTSTWAMRSGSRSSPRDSTTTDRRLPRPWVATVTAALRHRLE